MVLCSQGQYFSLGSLGQMVIQGLVKTPVHQAFDHPVGYRRFGGNLPRQFHGCLFQFVGGNQMRQPYLRGIVKYKEWEKYPEVEHIHHFGWYIGNYPDLKRDKIIQLSKILNNV